LTLTTVRALELESGARSGVFFNEESTATSPNAAIVARPRLPPGLRLFDVQTPVWSIRCAARGGALAPLRTSTIIFGVCVVDIVQDHNGYCLRAPQSIAVPT
jgi:hypothetical protein